jgi:N-methylhydantoinase A
MLLPATLDLLHARRVVVPPHPGLFSAIGLLSTDLVFYESRSAYVLLTPDAAPEIASVFEQLETQLRARIGDDTPVTVRRSFDGRLLGQSWETPFVELPDGPIDEEMVTRMVALFHDQYERRYGNRFDVVPVQGVTYRVQLVAAADKVEYVPADGADEGAVTPDRMLELRYLEDEPLRVGEYRRASLPIGARVEGPAIVREELSTTLVCPGQRAQVGSFGELVITQVDP